MSRGTVLLTILAIVVIAPLSWLLNSIGVARPYSTWVAGLLWMVAAGAAVLALDRRRRKNSACADPASRRD